MKKKILFLMPSFGHGGVESTLISLLNVMDRKKYDITLMMLNGSGNFFNRISKDIKICTMQIPEKEKGVFLGKKKMALKYLKNFQLIKLSKFIIYNRNVSLTENRTRNYEYFKRISKEIPTVEEEFDLAIDYFGYATFTTFYLSEKINAKKKISWLHSIMSRFEPFAFKEVYEKLDRIYACSEMVKKDFNAIFPTINTVEVFYNIINPFEIREKAQMQGGFDDNYDGMRILTVARICHEKGIDIAARTFNLLRKNGYNVRWYIIGAGEIEEKNKICEIIDNRDDFIFLGLQSNPYNYMKQCDIYVQPSRFEGYCTTTNEARIIGCPIVMTNVSGASEQIDNGKNGYIVDSDEVSLYNAIKDLLDSEELINQFKKNLKKLDCDTRDEVEKLNMFL